MKENLERIREKKKQYSDRGKKKDTDFEVGESTVLHRRNRGKWLPAKLVADTGH